MRKGGRGRGGGNVRALKEKAKALGDGIEEAVSEKEEEGAGEKKKRGRSETSVRNV
jgi:hypothetical protein